MATRKMIAIDEAEYEELTRKAKAYDDFVLARKKGANANNNKLTPEQRSERAKKAVEARKKKLGW